MVNYVKNIVEDFPEEITPSRYPWNDNLFKVDEKGKNLNKEKGKARVIHNFVAKGSFVNKHACLDIYT